MGSFFAGKSYYSQILAALFLIVQVGTVSAADDWDAENNPADEVTTETPAELPAEGAVDELDLPDEQATQPAESEQPAPTPEPKIEKKAAKQAEKKMTAKQKRAANKPAMKGAHKAAKKAMHDKKKAKKMAHHQAKKAMKKKKAAEHSGQ